MGLTIKELQRSALMGDAVKLKEELSMMHEEELDGEDAERLKSTLKQKQAEIAALNLEIASLSLKPIAAVSMISNCWDGSKNTGHSSQQLVFELTDNSSQHYSPPVPLRIKVGIVESETDKTKAQEIRIIDNGAGIRWENLVECFTKHFMAGQHGDQGISEHGVGLKEGLRGLGREVVFKTRAVGGEAHHNSGYRGHQEHGQWPTPWYPNQKCSVTARSAECTSTALRLSSETWK